MTGEELIARFRSDVHDTSVPHLWSDDEVVAYLDEALQRFCRETGGIPDSTSEVTRVAMVAGEPWGDVDPRVLQIKYAARESDNDEIVILNYPDVQYRPVLGRQYYSPLPSYLKFDDEQTGAVRALVTGMEPNRVRWFYVPAEDDVAKLIVDRLPLDKYTTDNLQDAPEIRPEHHIILVDGIKAAAYGKEDAECFDKGKRDQYESSFLAKCATVKTERERREHKPRLISYGGL